MRVRMKIRIMGSRDGVRWPAIGGEVDLPDHEAAKMCASGFAEPVVVEAKESRPAKAKEKRG